MDISIQVYGSLNFLMCNFIANIYQNIKYFMDEKLFGIIYNQILRV